MGHPVSDRTVTRMLGSLGFCLQGNAKVTEGNQHADRDAQFRYLATQVAEHTELGQPVVSVDAKKKELVGHRPRHLRVRGRDPAHWWDSIRRARYPSEKPKEYPRAPQNPVYKHDSSCGEQRPDATSIVHGLSVGWADTYPSSLPDQAIDITDLPDGDYVARVKVDGKGLIKESNEDNNTASVGITLKAGRVTVDVSTATGL